MGYSSNRCGDSRFARSKSPSPERQARIDAARNLPVLAEPKSIGTTHEDAVNFVKEVFVSMGGRVIPPEHPPETKTSINGS